MMRALIERTNQLTRAVDYRTRPDFFAEVDRDLNARQLVIRESLPTTIAINVCYFHAMIDLMQQHGVAPELNIQEVTRTDIARKIKDFFDRVSGNSNDILELKFRGEATAKAIILSVIFFEKLIDALESAGVSGEDILLFAQQKQKGYTRQGVTLFKMKKSEKRNPVSNRATNTIDTQTCIHI